MPAQPQPLRLNHRHFSTPRNKCGHTPPPLALSSLTFEPANIPMRKQLPAGALQRSACLRYTLPMGILRRLSRWMGKQDHMTHIVAGNTAPGLSLKALDNKEYSLCTVMARGPVVAAFFKISCPVCQFTFPFLERLYRRYGGDGLTFLGISQDDARSTMSFAKEYG